MIKKKALVTLLFAVLGSTTSAFASASADDRAIISFLDHHASGDLYLRRFLVRESPIDTNWSLSDAELDRLFNAFDVFHDAISFKSTPGQQVVRGVAIVDPSQKIVVTWQHCCSITQFSVVRYSSDPPAALVRRKLPVFTFGGFKIGDSLGGIVGRFGGDGPIHKQKDVYRYEAIRPDTPQGCGETLVFRFKARHLVAVALSEGC